MKTTRSRLIAIPLLFTVGCVEIQGDLAQLGDEPVKVDVGDDLVIKVAPGELRANTSGGHRAVLTPDELRIRTASGMSVRVDEGGIVARTAGSRNEMEGPAGTAVEAPGAAPAAGAASPSPDQRIRETARERFARRAQG